MAALALPVAGAFMPSQVHAAPANGTYQQASHERPTPYFFMHILAITDVLNQCGSGTQNPQGGVIHCPLLAPQETSASALSLY